MILQIYGWVVLGIVISVLLPILWRAVWRYFPKPATAGPASYKGATVSLGRIVKPYVVLGVASAVTAILIVAFLGAELTDFRAALLAGYAWDSTLQKLRP